MKKLIRLGISLMLVMAMISAGGCSMGQQDNLDEANGKYTVTKLAPDKEITYGEITLTMTIDGEPDEAEILDGQEPEDSISGAPTLIIKTNNEEGLIEASVKLADSLEELNTSYLLDDGENKYVMAVFEINNDQKQTVLVKLGEEIAAGDPIDFALVEEPGLGMPEEFLMSKKIDILGSYEGMKTFRIEGNKLVTDDKEYVFSESDKLELKVKKDFQAKTVDGEEITINKGEKIHPTGTDYKNKFYFKNQGGRDCVLVYEREPESFEVKICGIDQYKLFENLPYAD